MLENDKFNEEITRINKNENTKNQKNQKKESVGLRNILIHQNETVFDEELESSPEIEAMELEMIETRAAVEMLKSKAEILRTEKVKYKREIKNVSIQMSTWQNVFEKMQKESSSLNSKLEDVNEELKAKTILLSEMEEKWKMSIEK